MYFWFDIEDDLGLTESLVDPAEVFLWVSVYVKVYLTMKEMNLKYCIIFSWESLSAWNPEAEGVSQPRDNKQLLLVPWMMALYFMMAGTTWEMRKAKFYLMCEMSWGQVPHTISMSNKMDRLTETLNFWNKKDHIFVLNKYEVTFVLEISMIGKGLYPFFSCNPSFK